MLDLRILQITESIVRNCSEILQYYMRVEKRTKVWFENSEFVRKIRRATSWNFNRE